VQDGQIKEEEEEENCGGSELMIKLGLYDV
jgi:hypothetical protein